MGDANGRGGKPRFHPVDNVLIHEYNKTRNNQEEACFCYAPFRSLYFKYGGNAYPCCENVTYRLGVFPEDSIRDIWFGERMRRFREHIRHHDLDLGCTLCKHYLHIRNFHNIKARFYDYATPAESYPTRMEFQLANTCNLQCAMCDGWSSSMIRRNRDRLHPVPNPYDQGFVDQLEEFIPHLTQAHFVGGEPFIINVFLQIWERIVLVNPACQIIVQTNGTVLNDRIKAFLRKGNFSINVSLDSVNKQRYEQIRQGARFETTMKNIDYFVEYCRAKHTTFQITACPMQNNWREMPRLVRFANRKGSVALFHTVLYPRNYSLFGFSRRRLRFVHLYLRLALLGLPGFTMNQRVNRSHYRTLLAQIAHFYTDEAKKKEWLAFEEQQRRDLEEMREKERAPSSGPSTPTSTGVQTDAKR